MNLLTLSTMVFVVGTIYGGLGFMLFLVFKRNRNN